MPTVIKNGTLVTASDTSKADLLIDGEKIAVIGEGLETEGAIVIDATDRYVLPGGIDVHTHLQLPVGVTESSDVSIPATRRRPLAARPRTSILRSPTRVSRCAKASRRGIARPSIRP